MMAASSPEKRQERYMRDDLPMRLGNLASDLLRLSQWVWQPEHDPSAVVLMDQIAAMVEWNGESATEELVDVQREILRWRNVWPLEPARSLLAFRARKLSDRVLEMSGLLEARS